MRVGVRLSSDFIAPQSEREPLTLRSSRLRCGLGPGRAPCGRLRSSRAHCCPPEAADGRAAAPALGSESLCCAALPRGGRAGVCVAVPRCGGQSSGSAAAARPLPPSRSVPAGQRSFLRRGGTRRRVLAFLLIDLFILGDG